MRSRVLLAVLAALLLTAAVAVSLWRVPALRQLVLPEARNAPLTQPEAAPAGSSSAGETVQGREDTGGGASSIATTEDAARPAPSTGIAPEQGGREACPTQMLDPIADFARYIAERYAEWRQRGGVFLPARDLAALYGLDVYALPQGERPPSPGVTPVALQLGYFVVGPRFVETLVAQGEALRPVQERDLAESGGDSNTQRQNVGENGQDAETGEEWTRGLLMQTAAKARNLAACRDGESQTQQPGDGTAQEAGRTDCRFAHAFMQGLAGPEVDAGRLEAQTAAVLQDLAGRLEKRAGTLGQQNGQGAAQ
ncbi:hypothetical protein [Oceanidesulfovibrio marinus]|uniref:Uncharacterized protein n=1 Tax=Oceanidesulfovibrio marinus TaxID=370038 RepID=A0A6P1ZEC4_9BACT|nr:hypothetical protein [Oceanidesulfovibrio marinus]TVM32732.1 hypothetical protein DQK91_13545 [Oceanidesulfovibrio marinus]